MTKNYEIRPVTEQTLNLVIEFLAQREYECVSLMKRLLQETKSTLQRKDHVIFFVTEIGNIPQKQAIQGAFLLTKGGLLLHHFASFDFQSLIQPVLHKKNLYSIAGTAEGSALFEAIMRKPPQTIYNYHLMACARPQNLENIAKNKFVLPTGFSMHHCTLADADALYPLQKAYYMQEVMPLGEKFSEKNCRLVWKNILSEQTVCAIIEESTHRVVAKAGTNAKGLNWVQIGGVYTKPEYRNRGFARYLVQHFVQNNNKNTVLFVKKDNLPAIAAYKNAGFSVVGAYRICYL